MRYFLAGAMCLLAYAGGSPVHAANDVAAFSVRATVIASCTITPGRLVSPRGLAAEAGAGVCAPEVPPSTIAAPQPTVSVTHDGTNGLAILTIAF